jgi:hypothetical protein
MLEIKKVTVYNQLNRNEVIQHRSIHINVR